MCDKSDELELFINFFISKAVDFFISKAVDYAKSIGGMVKTSGLTLISWLSETFVKEKTMWESDKIFLDQYSRILAKKIDKITLKKSKKVIEGAENIREFFCKGCTKVPKEAIEKGEFSNLLKTKLSELQKVIDGVGLITICVSLVSTAAILFELKDYDDKLKEFIDEHKSINDRTKISILHFDNLNNFNVINKVDDYKSTISEYKDFQIELLTLGNEIGVLSGQIKRYQDSLYSRSWTSVLAGVASIMISSRLSKNLMYVARMVGVIGMSVGAYGVYRAYKLGDICNLCLALQVHIRDSIKKIKDKQAEIILQFEIGQNDLGSGQTNEPPLNGVLGVGTK